MRAKLRVAVSLLEEGYTTLGEEQSRYIVKVHRQKEGAALLLFDPKRALQAHCLITDANPRKVRVSVEAPTAAPTSNIPLCVLQGLGKADKPEQCVRDTTALGAEAVVFFHSERSVARPKSDSRGERLLRISEQVARQCQRGDLPMISGPLTFEEAVSINEVAGKPIRHRFVCAWHEEAVPLLRVAQEVDWSAAGVLLLIGPEGGLSDSELAQAMAQHFIPVSLGPYVLRTESACTAALSILRAAADAK